MGCPRPPFVTLFPEYDFLISFKTLIGQETTSNQLSFTLYEILNQPMIEERYVAEPLDFLRFWCKKYKVSNEERYNLINNNYSMSVHWTWDGR